MSNYKFDNLSAIDFEKLCRDLLQKEFSIVFESFTEGKDGGIDFLFRYSDNRKLILQCKRFTKDGFPSLRSELKKELKSVQKLNPEKYIIMTSFGLTPSNKEEVVEIFNPYIESTEFIYGRDDINNLLGRHQDIERKHYKLWLDSSNILDRFIHKELLNRSNSKFEEIKNKLKIFVMNNAYNDAILILNKYNYCIISGNPGIGKSTLADVLSFFYIQDDYEFCFVQNSISEAWKIFEEGKRQVFYFDDFLGPNFLEDGLERNEDADFMRFLRQVKSSPDKKLILTTREYILNQAKEQYEKLNDTDIDIAQCTIDMSSYGKRTKAKILYNHLFYSTLSEKYSLDILKDKAYKKIISHKNYNPRHIEFLTNEERLNTEKIKDNEYAAYFLKMLDNPEEIWKGAFKKIHKSSQYLLCVLTLAQDKIFMNDLELSFSSVYKNEARANNFEVNIDAFKESLRELEGSFITIEPDGKNKIIYFQNPSIKDFLINLIQNNSTLIEALISNIVFFDHFFNLFVVEGKNYQNKVKIKKEHMKFFVESVKKSFNFESAQLIRYSNEKGYAHNKISVVRRIQIINSFFSSQEKNLLHDFIVEQFNELSSDVLVKVRNNYDRLEFVKLLKTIGFQDSSKLTGVFQYFQESIDAPEDLECLQLLDESFPEFRDYFDVNHADFESAIEDFIAEEVSLISQQYDGSDTIRELENMGMVFSLYLDYSDLEEKISELNDYQETEADMQLEEWKSEKVDIGSEDRYIDSIFESLKESAE